MWYQGYYSIVAGWYSMLCMFMYDICLTALLRGLPVAAYTNCQHHAAATDTSARYVYVDCGFAGKFAVYIYCQPQIHEGCSS